MLSGERAGGATRGSQPERALQAPIVVALEYAPTAVIGDGKPEPAARSDDEESMDDMLLLAAYELLMYDNQEIR